MKIFVYIALLSFLVGCQLTPSDSGNEQGSREQGQQGRTGGEGQAQRRADLAIVEPALPSQSQQAEIAQINELMESDEVNDEQRATLYYRRGVLYDALGLNTLALLEMNKALALEPAMADAWHYVGIYYMQNGNYSNAYEAFDSVIELSPEHDFVYLNRGLTSYYDGQFDMAFTDFADFYFQDPSDAYRIAWQYFAAFELDSGRASEQLRQQMQAVPARTWGGGILRFLAGDISENQLISAAFQGIETHQELVERLCEAYFYLGKKAAMQGDTEQALNYFKLVLMTNVYSFVEHRVARAELYRLREADQKSVP
ncbi:lipoprotein NlpI [Aliidiomarina celeris]|uniref:lipoprotein NlpI n=1 Tax=Aliidiomarina celeris TaxID=2249428 RepID=UPI0013007091|nr:lipoprotein NlpI [Aliidiomarina celeris]